MLDQSQTGLLVAGARHFGLELSQNDLSRFSVYVEELQRWSGITNLVSQADTDTIIRKHILDSLAIARLIPAEGRVLDLGSGAGFPGLVLAIVKSSREIVLIETRRKRVSFLKEIARKMKIANLKVYEGRAEVLAAEESLRSSFAIVVTRATWSIKDFLQLANPFIKNEGVALTMKGLQIEKELADSTSHVQSLGFHLQKKHEYVLPFGNERHQVLLFTKKCST
ncbi:MAG: 16S rRNA (guanine(527)-N(7))-methyltransferase RsmG [Candidatus Binatia bacterium]